MSHYELFSCFVSSCRHLQSVVKCVFVFFVFGELYMIKGMID